MRNFILFIVVVSILSFTGFILYRVYFKGESPDAVFQEFRGNEEKPDVLSEAEDAYDQQEYAEALKGFEPALEAHESSEPGARLGERDHKALLLRISSCYKHLWEAGGKTDDTLRIKAIRALEKYLDDYPDDNRRRIGRGIAELKNPTITPAPASETADENPADENPADENPADESPADENPVDESPP